MNALKMMEDQHAEIETRLLKLETEALPSVQRQRLLQLASALHVHSTIEQKLFYPAAKARSTEEVIFAHIESHRAMNAIASELLGLNATSERYHDRLAALRSEFEEHVREERGDLFTQVRKLLDKARLEALGSEMNAMLEQLTEDPVVA
jgi:hypothetical protein